jgi:transposase-like protein
MAKHRIHSLEFKRQVAQEFLAGETLHGLAKRYDLSRNLIRIWVQKSAPRQKSAPTSVIVGPPVYPSLKDAG